MWQWTHFQAQSKFRCRRMSLSFRYMSKIKNKRSPPRTAKPCKWSVVLPLQNDLKPCILQRKSSAGLAGSGYRLNTPQLAPFVKHYREFVTEFIRTICPWKVNWGATLLIHVMRAGSLDVYDFLRWRMLLLRRNNFVQGITELRWLSSGL
jgi:hypothetical protein